MSASNTRDLRFDAIRGFALLLITIDHIEWFTGSNLLRDYTLHGLSFCDAAEVFVFISGIVCGIAYSRVLLKTGFWACQRKATRRAIQLYLANLLTLWAVFFLATILAEFGIVEKSHLHLRALIEFPLRMLPHVALQFYQPFAFDVLTLYCHLLLVLPIFLIGLVKRPTLTWIIVIGIYLFAQAFPAVNYPIYISRLEELSTRARPFNHFAWFMLFFMGSAFGYAYSQGRRFSIPNWMLATALTITVLIAEFNITGHAYANDPFFPWREDIMNQLQDLGLLSKPRLGAIRLLAFFSLIVIAVRLMPSSVSLSRHELSKALVGVGQNTLFLFCLSLVLVFATDIVFALLPESSWTVGGCHLAICGTLLAVGYYLFRVPAGKPEQNLTEDTSAGNDIDG